MTAATSAVIASRVKMDKKLSSDDVVNICARRRHSARLVAEQRREIILLEDLIALRKEAISENESMHSPKSLAKEFGVSAKHIYHVASGRRRRES